MTATVRLPSGQLIALAGSIAVVRDRIDELASQGGVVETINGEAVDNEVRESAV